MAQSKCPKCESTSFEAQNKRITPLNYDITFIQCSQCGCVVGTLDTTVVGNHISRGIEALITLIKEKK